MKTFVLRNAEILARIATALRECLLNGEIVEVQVKPWEPTRTSEQNRKMWSLLTDISEQVEWYGQHYSPADWKDILTAGLKREQRLAPGVHGGLVALGSQTSKMSVREMVELIEFIQWFAVDKGVKFYLEAAA